jgi:hypothetical protein
VVLTAVMAALVPAALPGRGDVDVDDARVPIPVWSLLLLGGAALAISVAGIPQDVRATAALLALGAAFVVAFFVVDRRLPAAVLPPSAFGAGPLKWIYLTLGLLMGATMVDMYVPLFGQRLADLTPVAAGFLGVGLAVGWTTAEIVSASLRSERVIGRTVVVAPLVMAFGLAMGALTMSGHPRLGLVVVWAAALLLTGIGVGMAWPHLSAWAMSRVDDPAEGPAAAAAINTVQLICSAFGAGLAGVAVNLTDSSDASSARWLFALFAVLAALGVIASTRSRGRTITTPAAVGAGSQPTTPRPDRQTS